MLLGELRQPDDQKRCQPEVVQVVGDLDDNLRSVRSRRAYIDRVADDPPARRQGHEAMVL